MRKDQAVGRRKEEEGGEVGEQEGEGGREKGRWGMGGERGGEERKPSSVQFSHSVVSDSL